jgi:hypothetical protein
MVEPDINNKPPVNKGGHPKRFKSAKELEDKIDEYFKDVESKEEKYFNEKTGIPTVIKTPAYFGRLLLYIGCTYSTIEPYEKGEYDDEYNKFSEALACARMKCEADAVEGASKGQYNDRVMTAVLKQHHGFVDRQEITNNLNINMQLPDDAAIERFIARRQSQVLAEKNVTPDDA